MAKFPSDAPLRKVISVLDQLGFRLVQEGNHIAMLRENPDGTRTPLTIPNHPVLKESTLRTILTQSRISRIAEPSPCGAPHKSATPCSKTVSFPIPRSCAVFPTDNAVQNLYLEVYTPAVSVPGTYPP
ncbi:MAG: type II toxin-antitoxin system HicA family toxin [Deltaproteobacteria bacterium]|nr:type II toxin-antitoxin system HicA family toxin [Deltaproteobacteria bacterium]